LAVTSGEREQVLDDLYEKSGFRFDESKLSPPIRQEITALARELAEINPLRHNAFELGENYRRQHTSYFRAELFGGFFVFIGLLSLAGSVGAGLFIIFFLGVLPLLWALRVAKPKLVQLSDARAKLRSDIDWKDAQLSMKTGDLSKMIVQELSAIHEQMLHPKQVNFNLNMDFTWLRTEMEKGGLVLSTVKCPQCGGRLELPATGDLVNCKYCGSTIRATDVFDKLRTLLK
jgi:hypothetical protein